MISHRHGHTKSGAGKSFMIANYTNHAANERTFLAWLRTGLAVAAFGFFLAKLNVFLDAVADARPLHVPVQGAGVIVSAAGHHIGLILALIGVATIVRGGIGFERARRAIDRNEVTQISHSYVEPVLTAVLSIAAALFCIYLALQ